MLTHDRYHVTDIDVEIAEMLVAHAAQGAGGSGVPHVLEGPFDKNLYIGSSIGHHLTAMAMVLVAHSRRISLQNGRQHCRMNFCWP